MDMTSSPIANLPEILKYLTLSRVQLLVAICKAISTLAMVLIPVLYVIDYNAVRRYASGTCQCLSR